MEQTELEKATQREQAQMARRGLLQQLTEQIQGKGLQSWVFPLKIDEKWLFEAFTHSSFLNESSMELASYERLEFLGDALLGQLVSVELFHNHPYASEGELSALKASLVSTDKWAALSDAWGLSEMCLHGRGLTAMTRQIKADLFESFAAFIYFNRGQEALAEFFMQSLQRDGGRDAYFAPLSTLSLNPRGDLQELCWQLWQNAPAFHVEERTSTEGHSIFQMSLVCGPVSDDGRKIVVSGEFKSKKEGQKALSQLALEELQSIKE